MKLKLLASIVLCILTQEIVSQNKFNDFPSPIAAELGRFGQVPVNYFNGLANISIPIYTIKLKEIQIPISLDYYSSGLKPDDHPGWTGIGWSLQTGGAITRIVNGRKDETTKYDISDETGILLTTQGLGYYYRSVDLDHADWFSPNFLMNYTGVPYAFHDTEPDEFLFNVAGMSGSFYFVTENGQKKIKVKSKQNYNLKIEEVFSEGNIKVFSFGYSARKTFWKFTITDGNGIQYTFGGNLDAIDFTTSQGLELSPRTIPTSWYLTSINTPSGDYINYEYKREGRAIINRKQKSKYCYFIKGSQIGNCPYNREVDDDNVFIQHISCLSKITASNGDVIQFSTSKSDELKYVYDNEDLEKLCTSSLYYGYDYIEEFELTNYWTKLTSIDISGLKKVLFVYTNNADQRLRLGEVKFKNQSESASLFSYKFSYNSNYLPSYNSKQTDHWGYYNGKFFGSRSYAELETFRTPNAALMKAEILEKISYPTGGFSIFEYEPHTYSKIMLTYDKISPFSLKKENGIAGGLRIKKITTEENAVEGANTKEFFYENTDGSSSGILSGKPVYTAGGKNHVKYEIDEWLGLYYYHASADYTQTYFQGAEFLLNPLSNTNGNHVTYSRVMEKLQDGSNSVYYYTNHEEFRDEPSFKVLTNIDDKTLDDPIISKELERGLLKAISHRNHQNLVVDSLSYTYSNDVNRYNNFVTSLAIYRNAGIDGSDFIRINPIKIYTFHPYLLKEENWRYGQNNQAIYTYKGYDYKNTDGYDQISQMKTINNTNDIYTIDYKYPVDFKLLDPYKTMVSKNIISPIIESSEYKQDLFLNKKSYEYTSPYSSFYAPANFKLQTASSTGPNEIRETYLYDPKGNLREIVKNDADKVVYLWAYNYQYPIAEIKGATYTEVLGKIAQSTLDAIAGKIEPTPSDLSTINALRTTLPGTLVTTYTYRPLVGMISSTDPRGLTRTYEYDTFGRLICIKDHNQNILETYNYHYKTQ